LLATVRAKETPITEDFDISSPAQLRAFDRALFDFLTAISRRGEPASVFVSARNDAAQEIKSVECDCPRTGRRLSRKIAAALKAASETSS
jgi:hypothetical protein